MPRGVYERKPRTAKADKPAKVAKPEKIKKVKADKAPKEPKIKVPRLPKGAGRIARKIANSAVDIVTQRSFGYQSELIKDRFQIFESAISTKMFNIYDHLAIARDGLPGDHIRDLNGEVVFFDNFEEARKFLTHS
jgi:hypothetical protein